MRFLSTSDTEFWVAVDGSDRFVAWSSIQGVFSNDKLFQNMRSLGHLIEQSALLLPQLTSSQAKWSGLESKAYSELKPRLPFKCKQFRDFYTFEEHVKAGRKGRGLEMIDEWYDFPVFYYSNHLQMLGPDEDLEYPIGSERLDLELEIGCVIGKEIRNASLDQAKEAIFGFCLLNDWTARDVQTKEMKLNMGPHKGKDFASSFGPMTIAASEIESRRKNKGFDLNFEAKINNEVLTRSNWSTIYYSFEEMIVHASKNCTLYPGEIIASGTMGGGCLMEHNLTRDEKVWLKKGDQVELSCVEIPELRLKTKVV